MHFYGLFKSRIQFQSLRASLGRIFDISVVFVCFRGIEMCKCGINEFEGDKSQDGQVVFPI